MKKQIYLDNAATTKVDEKVFEKMKPYFTEKYANASSSHAMGREAKDALERSRKTIAKAIEQTVPKAIENMGIKEDIDNVKEEVKNLKKSFLNDDGKENKQTRLSR